MYLFLINKNLQATIMRVSGQWKMMRGCVKCSSGLLALRKDFSMFGDFSILLQGNWHCQKIHRAKYVSAWNLKVQTLILQCESGGRGVKKEHCVVAIKEFIKIVVDVVIFSADGSKFWSFPNRLFPKLLELFYWIKGPNIWHLVCGLCMSKEKKLIFSFITSQNTKISGSFQ